MKFLLLSLPLTFLFLGSLEAVSADISVEKVPLRWDLFFQPSPIFSVFITLVLTALIGSFWFKRDEKDFLPSPTSLGTSDQNLKQFCSWVPVILGLHLAIPLLVNGTTGRLFYSTNEMPEIWANWMGLAEIMIALSLFYGALTRPAGMLIAFLWVLGIDSIGLGAMISSIQYLGFASFFYLTGRGPYSIDRILFPKLEPNINYIHLGLLLLRISVGISFIIFAFTEKLANIPAAVSLMEEHSFLNFTSISNETFVLIAGAMEMLGGILIALGFFPRLVALIALVCINASLTISNLHSLIDYLPTYAALAIFLIWEPHNPKQKLLWIEGLREN